MRHTVRLAILVPLIAIAAGCVTTDQLKAMSAGQTGCVPDAIDVSNRQTVAGGQMWNATCGGKKYLCTVIGESTKTSGQVSCAPAAQ